MKTHTATAVKQKPAKKPAESVPLNHIKYQHLSMAASRHATFTHSLSELSSDILQPSPGAPFFLSSLSPTSPKLKPLPPPPTHAEPHTHNRTHTHSPALLLALSSEALSLDTEIPEWGIPVKMCRPSSL